ncbi:MAG: hypothetical protein KBS60_04145 [Phascolarctobacterium sp.]|nr:hypothetical protein [Candidatus Phascolarctobacterium caballi]
MEKILGIAIVNGVASCVEIDDDLAAYYELLGCNCIEMPTRKIGKTNYIIICDEEGALKPNHISATNSNKETMIVGNCFICKEYNGDVISLEPNDIMHISRRFHRTRQIDNESGEIRTFTVVECEYPFTVDEIIEAVTAASDNE